MSAAKLITPCLEVPTLLVSDVILFAVMHVRGAAAGFAARHSSQPCHAVSDGHCVQHGSMCGGAPQAADPFSSHVNSVAGASTSKDRCGLLHDKQLPDGMLVV